MSTVPTQEPDRVREGWSRSAQPLTRRRVLVEVVVGGLFVSAAIALALLGDSERDVALGPAAVLITLLALGIRVKVDVGVSYTSPIQLVFVPMLLLLPPIYVPLFVLLGWLLGRLPDLFGPRRTRPDRLLLVPGDCWFAIGPALVLVLAGVDGPDWDDWPVYLCALAAQFATETVTSYVREWIGEGGAPSLPIAELALIWAIDTLLSPLGLLAAFASLSFTYAFVLLVAPVVLLSFYARERTSRLENALALAETARDRQHLVAGASHELVTPVAVLVGLTDRLAAHGDDMTGDRRAQIDAVMRREVLALKQVVRQFVDYTRIKTERDLALRPEAVDLGAVAGSVAQESSGRLLVTAPPELPAALIDPDRADQMVTAIAAIALEGAESARLELAATDSDVTVTMSSAAAPPQRPFAEGGEGSAGGLGLYVTRELARHQGGDVTAEAAGDGGARYVLTVPRAQ